MMKHASSPSDPPRTKQRERIERALAIILGLGALVLFGFSLFYFAWVLFPFCGIIGWAAYGFWTGTNVPASKGKAGWEDPLTEPDPTLDAEYSYVPGNINYPHVVDQSHQPPPPS